jgi:hypothetical protein
VKQEYVYINKVGALWVFTVQNDGAMMEQGEFTLEFENCEPTVIAEWLERQYDIECLGEL